MLLPQVHQFLSRGELEIWSSRRWIPHNLRKKVKFHLGRKFTDDQFSASCCAPLSPSSGMLNLNGMSSRGSTIESRVPRPQTGDN